MRGVAGPAELCHGKLRTTAAINRRCLPPLYLRSRSPRSGSGRYNWPIKVTYVAARAITLRGNRGEQTFPGGPSLPAVLQKRGRSGGPSSVPASSFDPLSAGCTLHGKNKAGKGEQARRRLAALSLADFHRKIGFLAGTLGELLMESWR